MDRQLIYFFLSTLIYRSSLSIVFTTGDENWYLTMGSQMIRPGQEYRLGAYLSRPLTLRATITKDNEQIASATANVPKSSLYFHTLQIPNSASDGVYRLTVVGMDTSSIVLQNTTLLQFSPNFLSIVVQTNRPIYSAGQTIHGRIVLLQTNMKPFYDGVDIYLLDPDGFIMRRWFSTYTHNGVATITFKLPDLTKDGYWKIRVKALNQIEEKDIKVETYFPPLFEVFVEMPPYVLDSEENLSPIIYGMFATEQYAQGNLTIEVTSIDLEQGVHKALIWRNSTFTRGGKNSYDIPVSLVLSRIGRSQQIEVKATLSDFLYGITRTGFSRTRVATRGIRVKFLTHSPAAFRPGLPYSSHLSITYEDNEPIPSEVLSESTLRLEVRQETDGGSPTSWFTIVNNELVPSADVETLYPDPMSLLAWPDTAVLGFTLMPRNNSERLMLTATFTDNEGREGSARLPILAHRSPRHRYMTIVTSTTHAIISEYAIFHVKTNFIISRFQYLIINKGSILSGDTIEVIDVVPTTTSFSIPVSAEMSPGVQVVVFHVTRDGELVTSSLYLPINMLSSYEINLEMSAGKDSSGNMVEVLVNGDAGAYIGVQAMRSMAFKLQSGHELSEARILDSFVALDSVNRTYNRVLYRSKDGSTADRIVYYPESASGVVPVATFNTSGLILISRGLLNSTDPCQLYGGGYPCFTSGCFTKQQQCDGISHCSDSSDEMNCPANYSEKIDFQMERMSKSFLLFDNDYDDWCRGEVLANDHSGIEQIQLSVPSVDEDWYVTAFTVSPNLGFAILKEPVLYSSRRLFTASIIGPDECHRGEQVSLQIILINHDTTQSLVLLQLLGSPDYKFVHVEPGGYVSSYSAKLTSGEHQLLIYLGPESQEHIDFPIAPTIEQGTIEVQFVASTQSGGATLVHTLNVLPEGVIIKRHTPLLLDLKNRALELSYMDIVVEETPIVPYQDWRRYVYGSPSAQISVSGDMIGPALPLMPLDKEKLLYSFGKGTDTRMFEFGMNVLTLHYLRLTSQLAPDVLYAQLDRACTLFAHIMKRFNPHGYFTNWDGSQPSVWLTAWVLRLLRQAVYAEWENTLYIEEEIFARSVEWLVYHQTPQGSFYEPSYLQHSLDSKIQANESDIGLTAHVLIALTGCLDLLEGETRVPALRAKTLAVRYLEISLYSLHDTYKLALVAYALSVAQSNERDLAFRKLMASSRKSIEGYEYWSWREVINSPIKLENQRPFLKPRTYHEGDSESVEGTGYALLVLLDREGVTPIADRIVAWLQTMRTTHTAFVSITDTLVATQALTEYANHARLFDITKVDVALRVSSSPDFKPTFHISNHSPSHSIYDKIPNVWGHVNVVARGSGLALVQLEVSYGVDYEPIKDLPSEKSFDLTITEKYNTFRNKSAITIQACTRWVREWPEVSGGAVLEIDLPTGYRLLEDEATALTENHPLLAAAMTRSSKTLWFFEYVPREWVCFNHTIRRWFPVANMTLYRQATIYELTARERFEQVLMNSTGLYLLNICEVCGSYQCPYCPFYNEAPPIRIKIYLLTISTFLTIFIDYRWKRFA